jgi:hypothetical protein
VSNCSSSDASSVDRVLSAIIAATGDEDQVSPHVVSSPDLRQRSSHDALGPASVGRVADLSAGDESHGAGRLTEDRVVVNREDDDMLADCAFPVLVDVPERAA